MAPAAPRTRARAAAAAAPTETVEAGPQPMFVLTTPDSTPEPPKRAPFFSLDGTVYDAPVTFTPQEGLLFVRLTAQLGVDAAADWLLETALGADGYNALLAYSALSAEHANGMLAELRKRILGAMSAGKGLSNAA